MKIKHAFLLIGLLLIMISCNTTKQAIEPKINVKELVLDPETVLVDVRIPEEFKEKSATNAVNIPLAEIENNLEFFKKQKKVVLFCNRGIQAQKALDLLKKNGIENVYTGKTVHNVNAIQNEELMNILEKIEFSTEKPNILQIKNTDKVKYFAVALGKGAVLKKHTTTTPATLIVLKGEINFMIEGKELIFKQFDTYEIPVNVEHEVHGISDKNVFTLTKEL